MEVGRAAEGEEVKLLLRSFISYPLRLGLMWGSNQSLGFPDGAGIKNLPANAGDIRDMDSVPGLGRSPGVGNGNLLQYSRLKNSVDKGAWWTTVHGAAKSRTQLSTHTQPDLVSLLTSLVN